MTIYDRVINIAIKAGAIIKETDYLVDTITYCGLCRTPKQAIVKFSEINRIVPIPCECRKIELENEKEVEAKKHHIRLMGLMRESGISEPSLWNCTFENDNGNNPKIMGAALRYAEKWDEVYQKNCGLLFWGNVGTGKTYAALSIANYLIDRCIKVEFTKFTTLVNYINEEFDEKNERFDNLKYYKLLIVDDLGTERQSDYTLEQIGLIIDSRYTNKQPIIFTTNLTLEELKNPSDIKYKRMYDRILEMCVPIKVTGDSMREQKAQDKLLEIKKLFETD